MRKIITILFLALILTGCSLKNSQANYQVQKQDTTLKTSYTPDNWVVENGTFYSPEMYNMREGGPYSLNIKINKEFRVLKDYLASKKDCIKNKVELSINSHQAVQFIDLCAYSKPKITIVQLDNNLIEAFSYSISDENSEIIKILNSLELVK